jgi:hypothetical protein
MTEPLISIRDAAERGIQRLRQPVWKIEFDHIELTLVDGTMGPWAKFWSPFNRVCNNRDPIHILIASPALRFSQPIIDSGERVWVEYTGAPGNSEAYNKEAEGFEKYREFLTKGTPFANTRSVRP